MKPRFLVKESSTSKRGARADIIIDTKTGVQYLAYGDGTCGNVASGIIPLIDSNGKPLISKTL